MLSKLTILTRLRSFLLLSVPLLTVVTAAVSCDPDRNSNPNVRPSLEISKATAFARDVLDFYYLWKDEIQSGIGRLDPDTCTAPCTVVEEIRYHENGAEVDHWTILTSDLNSLINSVQGLGTSYGYYLAIGKLDESDENLLLVVNYACRNSPADRAGLKRGDVIVTVNGSPLTYDNLDAVVYTSTVTLGVTKLDRDPEGKLILNPNITNVRLTAENIYEDPVYLHKIFEFDGKKVGYLVYNSFDLKSTEVLPSVFKGFREENISELIIDLRYNGGGYSKTCQLLASLTAPLQNVLAEDVFSDEVCNSDLAEIYSNAGIDTRTCFVRELTSDGGDGKEVTLDLTEAKPEISKVYFIVTGNSASASESIIVGLKPYMDVELIGAKTGGKYCSGFMLAPEEVYNTTYNYSAIRDWGIYVMFAKYTDRDGNNPAIPDGIAPDVQSRDVPYDGFQLGDPDETMLKAALMEAGWKPVAAMSAEPVKTSPTISLVPLAPKPSLLLRQALPVASPETSR